MRPFWRGDEQRRSVGPLPRREQLPLAPVRRARPLHHHASNGATFTDVDRSLATTFDVAAPPRMRPLVRLESGMRLLRLCSSWMVPDWSAASPIPCPALFLLVAKQRCHYPGVVAGIGAYLGVVAAITAVPGPDTLVVTRNAAHDGFGAGAITAAGSASGLLIWGSAAAVGLAAVLRASAMVFDVLRVVGAVYLAFLGLRAVTMSVTSSEQLSIFRQPLGSSEGGIAPSAIGCGSRAD
jgi:LysE type translocator